MSEYFMFPKILRSLTTIIQGDAICWASISVIAKFVTFVYETLVSDDNSKSVVDGEVAVRTLRSTQFPFFSEWPSGRGDWFSDHVP